MFQCMPLLMSGGWVRGVTKGEALPVQRIGTSSEVSVNAPAAPFQRAACAPNAE